MIVLDLKGSGIRKYQTMSEKKLDKTYSTRFAKGLFDPVVYFENYRGTIAIPPSTEDALRLKAEMARRGFILREAGTIAHIEDLQRRLQDQEKRKREGRLEREEHIFDLARKERKDRLLQRRNSSACTPFERDAIDAHLKLMDEKHEARVKREREVNHYFEALEFNSSSHHLLDAVNNVPDMSSEACTRCHSYRRVSGLTICAPCANQIGQESG